MRRSWALRLLTFVVTLLHLAVPPLATVADTRATQDGVAAATAGAHWEEHGSPRHPRVHAPDCALCQYLTALQSPARGAPELPAARTVVAPAADTALEIRADVGASRLARPRAPPTA